jgi:hypothetical protein
MYRNYRDRIQTKLHKQWSERTITESLLRIIKNDNGIDKIFEGMTDKCSELRTLDQFGVNGSEFAVSNFLKLRTTNSELKTFY